MKKTYKEPTMLAVTLQHANLLMGSLEDKTGGNADFHYDGASSGDVEGRVKEHSHWDDEW